MADVVSTLALVLLVGSGLLIAAYIVYRVLTRHQLELGSFDLISVDIEELGGAESIRRSVNKRVREIASVHQASDQFDVDGEADRISQIRPTNETIESSISIVADVSNIPLLGFAFRALDLLYPRLTLNGEITGETDLIRVSARLNRGRRVLDTIDIEVLRGQPDTTDLLVDEVAYDLTVTASSNDVIRGNNRVGTKNWRAFRNLTLALKLVNSERELYSLENEAMAGRALHWLKEAIAEDPEYARAQYNCGALLYNKYLGVEYNMSALGYFQRAADLLEQMDARERDRELLGLAYVGKSRSLSQMVHRYGRRHEESHVSGAREAARKALEHIPGDPRALYATGFAWHCTEELDDIEEGRKYYELIIERHPQRYAVVHNNLGYILLEAATIHKKGDDLADATDLIHLAIEQLNLALKSEPKPTPRIQDFAYSNLGKAYRYLGKYEVAKEYHDHSLKFRDSDSRYAGGLQDLAETLIAAGELDDGLSKHFAALNRSSDAAHRVELMRKTLEALSEAGLGDLSEPTSLESDDDLDEWQKYLNRELHTRPASDVSDSEGASKDPR